MQVAHQRSVDFLDPTTNIWTFLRLNVTDSKPIESTPCLGTETGAKLFVKEVFERVLLRSRMGILIAGSTCFKTILLGRMWFLALLLNRVISLRLGYPHYVRHSPHLFVKIEQLLIFQP